MKNKLKDVFDNIYAEEKLKKDTAAYIKNKLYTRKKIYDRLPLNRFAAVLALTLAGFLGIFFNMYFRASAYVDLDVNPSVELAVNRFGRIIGIYIYNAADASIISELSLKHKNYVDALKELINSAAQNKMLDDNGIISITLQTNDFNKENELLNNIKNEIPEFLTGHHNSMAQIDIFPVNGDTRANAHELDISPAKYIAIRELMDADPTVTFESCKYHSISEIKQSAKDHRSIHHNENNIDGGTDIIETNEDNGSADVTEISGSEGGINEIDNVDELENMEQPGDGSLHHDKGKNNGHSGGHH